MEEGDGAGGDEMKELYIVDEITPAESLTLGEEESTAMSKIIKQIAHFCFIYNVTSKHLAE